MTRADKIKERLEKWTERLETVKKEWAEDKRQNDMVGAINKMKEDQESNWKERRSARIAKFQADAEEISKRIEQRKREEELEDTIYYGEFMLQEAEEALDEAIGAIAAAEKLKRELGRE